MVLDSDGGVVVPVELADATMEVCRARLAREDDIRRRIADGEFTYDMYGFDRPTP